MARPPFAIHRRRNDYRRRPARRHPAPVRRRRSG